MFQRLGPNAMRSDTGFAVKRNGRHDLSYTEGEKVLTIEIEPGDGLAVYFTAAEAWDSPNDDILSQDDRIRIRENIACALTYLGIKHVIM